ncbi:hypothetical protein pb186bvf_007996 [Paramecium bursaria]
MKIIINRQAKILERYYVSQDKEILQIQSDIEIQRFRGSDIASINLSKLKIKVNFNCFYEFQYQYYSNFRDYYCYFREVITPLATVDFFSL